jgi:hypothetical protein
MKGRDLSILEGTIPQWAEGLSTKMKTLRQHSLSLEVCTKNLLNMRQDHYIQSP